MIMLPFSNFLLLYFFETKHAFPLWNIMNKMYQVLVCLNNVVLKLFTRSKENYTIGNKSINNLHLNIFVFRLNLNIFYAFTVDQ